MQTDEPSDRRRRKPPPARTDERWAMPAPWRPPSPEDVSKRFDELIHHRWRRDAEAARTSEGILLYEEVWIEMDLPGVEKREVRGRLELRMERGGLRVRISKAPQS